MVKVRITITLKCCPCGSEHLVRDGFTRNGKQRYWCHACQHSSREQPRAAGDSTDEQEQILKAYEERSSVRELERVFGVSHKTVSTWLKKGVALPPLSTTLIALEKAGGSILELR